MNPRQIALLTYVANWRRNYPENSPQMNALISKMLDGLSVEISDLKASLETLLRDQEIWRR